MNPLILLMMLWTLSGPSHAAWSWNSLWLTPDQLAQQLMKKGQYSSAKTLFTNPAWQATAAFRAQDYTKASELFGQLNTADGFYNQGNALAHSGAYEQAIQAYDQSLALRPQDADTLHNRKIIQALIKKPEQKQEQDGKQEQNQKEQKQEQNQEQEQNKSDQDNSERNRPSQPQQNEQKPDPDVQEKTPQQTKTTANGEDNQHWLNLIPDDPGGLLREKFLRDHLRRLHGENV